MKRFGFIFFIIIPLSSCFCATQKPTSNDLAFQAESLIINNQFEKAIEIYEQILKMHKPNSYVDLHNACLCYIRLKRYREALTLSENLVLNGYALKDFEANGFSELRSNPLWSTFVKEYPRLRIKYLATVDTVYRNKILHTIRNDQKASLSYYPEISDSIYYWQGVSLLKLFNQYGFPACFINKDTLSHKLTVVFRHYFGLFHRYNSMTIKSSVYKQMNFESNNLENALIKEIQNGNLHPKYLLGTYNWSEQGNKYGNIIVKISLERESLKLYQLSTTNLEKINFARGKVGLPKIANDILDTLVTQTQKNFPFRAIKESYMNCTTCKTGRDYANLSSEIMHDNNGTSLISNFIFQSLPEINTWWFIDDNKFFRKNDSDSIAPK